MHLLGRLQGEGQHRHKGEKGREGKGWGGVGRGARGREKESGVECKREWGWGGRIGKWEWIMK